VCVCVCVCEVYIMLNDRKELWEDCGRPGQDIMT
jgi:hypothetical protein